MNERLKNPENLGRMYLRTLRKEILGRCIEISSIEIPGSSVQHPTTVVKQYALLNNTAPDIAAVTFDILIRGDRITPDRIDYHLYTEVREITPENLIVGEFHGGSIEEKDFTYVGEGETYVEGKQTGEWAADHSWGDEAKEMIQNDLRLLGFSQPA